MHDQDQAPTVRDLLDNSLPLPRVQSLEVMCTRIARCPLDGTLADLRQALTAPITREAGRRLHVLISTLYHRAGVSRVLAEELRAAIEAAQTGHRDHTVERSDNV